MSDEEELIFAKQQDSLEDIGLELQSLIKAVKDTDNINAINSIASAISGLKKELAGLKPKDIDLSPLLSAIDSISIEAPEIDLSGIKSSINTFSASNNSLEKKIDSLSGKMDELISAFSRDSKISIEREGGQITNLYVIRNL
jgi:hypothetical protein